VATLGLILASTGSTPVAASTFLSSTMPRISGEVLRHFCDWAATIRVSRPLRELQSVIYDVAAELSQRHSRAPRPSEIAQSLRIDVERVLQGLPAQGAAHAASLEQPAWDDDSHLGGGRVSRRLRAGRARVRRR
jgi:RNA polymerase sigma-B factor